MDIQRINDLIKFGNEILKTKYYEYSYSEVYGIKTTVYCVDSQLFSKWKNQVKNLLINDLGINNHFTIEFNNNVFHNNDEQLKIGLGILEALLEESENNNDLIKNNVEDKSIELERVLNRFHNVARNLLNRRENRETLKIKDEYDVQDLLASLLKIYFDDIRPEEWTPSNAGSANRIDFLIKDINVGIEVKKTNEHNKDKEIGKQLQEDIENYFKHPDCNRLYCFIYDPDELIVNPDGLINDLSKKEPEVKIIINPKF